MKTLKVQKLTTSGEMCARKHARTHALFVRNLMCVDASAFSFGGRSTSPPAERPTYGIPENATKGTIRKADSTENATFVKAQRRSTGSEKHSKASSPKPGTTTIPIGIHYVHKPNFVNFRMHQPQDADYKAPGVLAAARVTYEDHNGKTMEHSFDSGDVLLISSEVGKKRQFAGAVLNNSGLYAVSGFHFHHQQKGATSSLSVVLIPVVEMNLNSIGVDTGEAVVACGLEVMIKLAMSVNS